MLVLKQLNLNINLEQFNSNNVPSVNDRRNDSAQGEYSHAMFSRLIS